MTYYEELGLERDASREEIRHAYKRLVRLLHPDQCMEESTRRLADLQMKRLNAILSVLMDAETRAAYDCSLLAALIKRPEPAHGWYNPRWWRPTLGVGGVFVVLSLCAVLPLRQPPQRLQRASPGGQSTASPPPKPALPTVPRRARRATQVDDPSPPESFSGYPPETAESRAAAPAAAVPAEPARFADQSAPRLVSAIAGEWLFVASSSTRNTGYPPEYIELRVTDNHGTIRGRYRARYRVGDRAISPNVAFQFEGRAAPDGGVLPWRGAEGSHGEVTLHLLANGDLDVEWTVDQMGEELGLISGKATLTRKLE